MSTPQADNCVRSIGPISAVVCNYNGEDYLAACIDALLASEHPLDEILVVDNQSTDRSLGVLAERYPAKEFPQLRVIEAGSNDGPARARNLGMREARNRWVLSVDNDAACMPDMLAGLVLAAEQRADAVIIQPRSVFAHEPTRVHYDGGRLHYAGLIALRNFYRPLATAHGQGAQDVDVAISVLLLVDRDVLMAAGGYDETYFILFEDLDLSCRLRMAGHGIVSVESAIVRHDIGTPGISFREGKSYPSRRVFFHSRNRWLYLLKCYRWRTLLFASPGLVVYELIWLAFAIRHGGLFAWMRGKFAVVRLLPQLRAKRAQAQRERVIPDRNLLVEGPLTLTPSLSEGSGALPARVLQRVLAIWWCCVRRLCG
ncbi:MAG: GT2 family glycosyltransferase [Planctomycetota bacterium]|jgi:GT2 family glycosyltransferase